MTDRQQFIESNLALVHSLAARFKNRGIEYDELYQAGCLGLVKAVDGFDESRGFAFSTYAVPVILGEIKKLFREQGTVKVSRSMKERARLAAKMLDTLCEQLNREPTLRELAEKLSVSEYEAAELLNVNSQPLSLTGSQDEAGRQFDIPVESREEEIGLKIALNEALSELSDEDRRLIVMRYFGSLTQARTAEKLGLTQVQVSRRERKLLAYMKKRLTR